MFTRSGKSIGRRARLMLAATTLVAVSAMGASPNSAQAGVSPGFAPYVDMTLQGKAKNTNNIRQSGAKATTLAFIVSGATCQASWGGYYGLNSSDSWFDAKQLIADVRAAGSEPMISFGGAAGQSLARTCTSPAALATQYQSVIDAYNVRNLDYDIEGSDQADPNSLTRRFQAIAKVQADGIAAGKPVSVSLTLPTMPSGLTYNGMNVVRSAIANGVDVSVVNVMAMDYYDSSQNPAGKMGDFAVQAGENLKSQLATLYPSHSDAALYRMVGLTPMIGINDNPVEIFTTADATKVLNWANAKSIGRIAMWSLNRDFQCASPISYASIHCSGVTQSALQFSSIWKTFEAGGTAGGTGGDPAVAPDLDTSKTKGRQKAKKLRLKLTADQASALGIRGKAKVAQPKRGSSSAKTKNFKLKQKTGIQLQAGVKKATRLKFKKNSKTLKKIKKLQKGSKRARKNSKMVIHLTATSALGVSTTSKLKIKLKR
jgi:hypothetical protein